MRLAILPGMQGPWEVLLILAVVLIIFGGKRLPDLARSLGKSLGEFKKGRREGELEARLEAKVEGSSEGDAEGEPRGGESSQS